MELCCACRETVCVALWVHEITVTLTSNLQLPLHEGLALHCHMTDCNVALWLDCSFYIGMAGVAAAAPESMRWLLLL